MKIDLHMTSSPEPSNIKSKLLCCSILTGQRSLLRHALDAVDAVVSNLGPLPAPMAAMLFQNEKQLEAAPVLLFHASMLCPKIGVVLVVEGDRNPLTAPLPDRSFNCLEAVMSDVSCELRSSGEPASACLHFSMTCQDHYRIFSVNPGNICGRNRKALRLLENLISRLCQWDMPGFVSQALKRLTNM